MKISRLNGVEGEGAVEGKGILSISVRPYERSATTECKQRSGEWNPACCSVIRDEEASRKRRAWFCFWSLVNARTDCLCDACSPARIAAPFLFSSCSTSAAPLGEYYISATCRYLMLFRVRHCGRWRWPLIGFFLTTFEADFKLLILQLCVSYRLSGRIYFQIDLKQRHYCWKCLVNINDRLAAFHQGPDSEAFSSASHSLHCPPECTSYTKQAV